MNFWRWALLGSIAIIPGAAAVQIVGPLLAQNNLSEIAASGSTAQSTARTNLGIGGSVPPWMPIAGGTFTGPVIFGTGATLTTNDAVALTPASGKSFAITPVTAGTINNVVIGGSTPLAGSFTTLSATGQITSTLATGTAPLVIASTTNVANLNASSLGGATFAAPGPIGSGTPGTGAFTTLTANNTVTLSPANTTVTISPSGTGSVVISPATTVAISPTGNLTLKGQTYTAAGAVSLGTASSTVGSGTYYAGHSLIGVQTFCLSGCTTTSTGTYTATAGTNQWRLRVQAAGGGGGGCAATDAAHNCVGGSGAAGSFMEGIFTSGVSGLTVTIGAAGTAGSSGSNPGGTGGTTSVGTLISCPGGTAGPAGLQTTGVGYLGTVAGAAAPSACTNSGGTILVNRPGQGTTFGYSWNLVTGGQAAAKGGDSGLGNGSTGLAASAATSPGSAGTGYGWGATGSISDASQSATVGLAGGPSIVIIEEYN